MEKLDRNYKRWFGVKSDIQCRKGTPHFKEWQIWWGAVGENVGVEIGTLDDQDIERIRAGLWRLYFQKNTPSIKKGIVGKSQTYLYCIKLLRKVKRRFSD